MPNTNTFSDSSAFLNLPGLQYYNSKLKQIHQRLDASIKAIERRLDDGEFLVSFNPLDGSVFMTYDESNTILQEGYTGSPASVSSGEFGDGSLTMSVDSSSNINEDETYIDNVTGEINLVINNPSSDEDSDDILTEKVFYGFSKVVDGSTQFQELTDDLNDSTFQSTNGMKRANPLYIFIPESYEQPTTFEVYDSSGNLTETSMSFDSSILINGKVYNIYSSVNNIAVGTDLTIKTLIDSSLNEPIQ